VNRQIRRLTVALLACFTIVFIQLNVVQIVRADRYNEDPTNDREAVRDFSRDRGAIISADQVVVAESIDSSDRFKKQRRYPTGDLFGHVTGYLSFVYGSDGVERTYNDVLAGRTPELQLENLDDLFSDRTNVGDVILTLRADLQQVARDALGEREGSVVLLDPRSGAIKAMWSFPSYDPNLLASHDFDAVGAVRTLLLADPRNPLLANSYRENYLTGSTFKVITASAGLESGVYTLDSFFPPTDSYTPPQTDNPIQNYGGTTCGGTFAEVFRRSCNTAFAEMAVTLGPQIMVDKAEDYGFNMAPPFDLPRPARSNFGTVEFFEDNIPLLAIGGFGQGETMATPLEMALVAAGVANGGVIMEPYVVAETRGPDGNLLDRTEPEEWRRAIEPDIALTMRDLMVQVVNDGTARCCMQLANGVQAAAKTGTAQLNPAGEPPASHAWIIAFAPAEAPQFAIAVMVKAAPEVTAGTGGTVAGPIARQVLDAALASEPG
jgi:peptidoglycan glycosyltransferase